MPSKDKIREEKKCIKTLRESQTEEVDLKFTFKNPFSMGLFIFTFFWFTDKKIKSLSGLVPVCLTGIHRCSL